jgi:putative oxidoreductase
MLTSPLVLRLIGLFMFFATALQPIAALVTRLVIGWMFFGTGHGKWVNFENTVQFFTDKGIPAPRVNAAFIASLELAGGLCLMAGLCTRIIAFLLSCTMVVAILTADWADFTGALGGGKKDLLDVTPVPPLMFLLWLLAFGAGAISLDRILFRKYGTPTSR